MISRNFLNGQLLWVQIIFVREQFYSTDNFLGRWERVHTSNYNEYEQPGEMGKYEQPGEMGKIQLFSDVLYVSWSQINKQFLFYYSCKTIHDYDNDNESQNRKK
eukprot:TRINITY_DN1796_c1_g1_i1.p4 TRINITY_DN1796_c1_g1~~TRINITY_DN1796_c1_g1_i1.p4  ORF type:complete len:104 (+),score=6.01 TRINITY_DN1796_c1_g1_i1:575-886(+)